MKIQQVINRIGKREIPWVEQQTHISEIIQLLTAFPYARLVYVVDDRKRLLGTISVGSLLRHIFPYHYKARIHPGGILRSITAQRAEQIMGRENVSALPDETVDEVLKRMARTGVKEMAVIDAEGIIIGDITAVDLLHFYPFDTDSPAAPDNRKKE